jgi:hypothetical protein
MVNVVGESLAKKSGDLFKGIRKLNCELKRKLVEIGFA